MTKALDGMVIDDNNLLLPEPERRDRKYLIISPDDHLVEPPDLFDGRMSAKYGDRVPHVIELEDGSEAWLFDGKVMPQPGFIGGAGRWQRQHGDDTDDPIRFDQMRRGVWDIHARVKDMDLDGEYAQLCFPSYLTGFGGIRLQTTSKDTNFSLDLVRAWNDWMYEVWAGAYPGRQIPNQITWLLDPKIGADEIRRNAARGFRAVTFPERPTLGGLPSLHTDYWDPFIEACVETGTVISVHTGSAGGLPAATSEDCPRQARSAFFGSGYALSMTIDWLYSTYPDKYEDFKIIISEGGVGWVPSLLDRLDHVDAKRGDMYDLWKNVTPSEALQRNFWFCIMDEPSATAALSNLERVGIDKIMFETDYPHSDSSWPDTQALADLHFKHLPEDVVRKMTWENASTLFQFPVPEHIQKNPNAF